MDDWDRFWAYVGPFTAGGCRLWEGPCTPDGYGVFYAQGRRWMAHRWVLVASGVLVPETVDHLCVVPPCVAPWHLEPVTWSENSTRTWARRRGVLLGLPAAA